MKGNDNRHHFTQAHTRAASFFSSGAAALSFAETAVKIGNKLFLFRLNESKFVGRSRHITFRRAEREFDYPEFTCGSR
jgi:hypothetical protein